jgi:hypothetical protein
MYKFAAPTIPSPRQLGLHCGQDDVLVMPGY